MKINNLKPDSIHVLKVIFGIIICFSIQKVESQTLSAFYKKNQISLKESPDYASENDWQKLFFDADKFEYGKNTGSMKGIIVAPDGSVFMCHRSSYEIWKFDKNGNYIKKFGSKGSKPGQFPFHFSIFGLLDGKYLCTYDVQGRIMVFDIEGKFIKKLQVDYMPLEMVALKGSKIAILGFVVGKKNKHIVTIKDFNTGNEKIIWSKIQSDIDKSAIVISMPGLGIMSESSSLTHPSVSNPRLATSRTGNLLVGLPEDGTIIEYAPSGSKIKIIALNIKPITLTDADINENYACFVDKAERFAARINNEEKFSPAEKQEIIKQYKDQLWKMKDKNILPKHLPYFSSMIIDSDGNILVFEFTKKEKSNKFKVYAYDKVGTEIGTSSFESANFELSFIPSNFAFCKGYIYAVAENKNKGKVPLRLVKLKLN